MSSTKYLMKSLPYLVGVFILFAISCGRSPFEKKLKKNTSKKVRLKSFSRDIQNVKKDGLKFNFVWSQGPRLFDESVVELVIDNFIQLENYFFIKAEAYLWMPDMGHGSYPISIQNEGEKIVLQELFFTMPGIWDLHIEIHYQLNEKKLIYQEKTTLEL